MVLCMDQAHHGQPQAAQCIYTLHPLKLRIFRGDWATRAALQKSVHTVTVEVHILPEPVSSSQGRKSIPCSIPSLWRERVMRLQSVFPSLISDLSISHGLLLCSGSQLHHSSSFLELPGADDVQGCADRQSIWERDRETHQGQPWEGRSRRSQEALVPYQFQHVT